MKSDEDGTGRGIPDYETYDFRAAWRRRGIEDDAEKKLVERWGRPGGEAALDLGGGFGRIAVVLERQYRNVALVDYSVRNLRAASTMLKGSTTLVRSDLARLPFEDDSFDFVSLVRVMHHIHRPQALIEEIVRVGRDGGTFVMSDPNPVGPRLFRGGPARGEWVVGPQGHVSYASRPERYSHPSLSIEEMRGVGMFDNNIGAALERLSGLSLLDVRTSRFWPAKSNLFMKFKITKGRGRRGDARVICPCGGRVSRGRCPGCGTEYGRIIDLVEDGPPSAGTIDTS